MEILYNVGEKPFGYPGAFYFQFFLDYSYKIFTYFI